MKRCDLSATHWSKQSIEGTRKSASEFEQRARVSRELGNYLSLSYLYARSPPSRMGAYWYRPLNGLGDHGERLGTQHALRARLPELRDLPDPDQHQPF
jgi:hypothetical protein